MALTKLQQAVMQQLSKNRTESSYFAGGATLNKDWGRLSDDFDVFHDTDEEINDAANKDIASLEAAGFTVSVDVRTFGCVEATVRRNQMEATTIQWMSESKTRFFPLMHDAEWGTRLHPLDLAVNKVVAASNRRTARDHLDLVTISRNMCELGPLIMAAAGKPPHFSPQKIVESLRAKGLSISNAEFVALRGVPASMTPAKIRDALVQALDRAETYIASAPAKAVGVLVLNQSGKPVEMNAANAATVTLRSATDEHEVPPQPTDASFDFNI